ncbi:hypothetical protein GCM10007332_02900 [Epilithonimonas arachidiradicis]|uniref:Uncharacterized protein n=1 Tax=Epilithonimonas arachidiradicis TaxID=1617282 RepID=A0ABQ1WTP3_9FLAO|nr:hypothetical protein GCM10007332_02900 [Epilithonimonas arachidiradicis]
MVTDDATSAGAGVVAFAVLSIATESLFGISVFATVVFALSQEYNNVTPAIRIFIVFNALIFIKIKIFIQIILIYTTKDTKELNTNYSKI